MLRHDASMHHGLTAGSTLKCIALHQPSKAVASSYAEHSIGHRTALPFPPHHGVSKIAEHCVSHRKPLHRHMQSTVSSIAAQQKFYFQSWYMYPKAWDAHTKSWDGRPKIGNSDLYQDKRLFLLCICGKILYSAASHGGHRIDLRVAIPFPPNHGVSKIVEHCISHRKPLHRHMQSNALTIAPHSLHEPIGHPSLNIDWCTIIPPA